MLLFRNSLCRHREFRVPLVAITGRYSLIQHCKSRLFSSNNTGNPVTQLNHPQTYNRLLHEKVADLVDSHSDTTLAGEKWHHLVDLDKSFALSVRDRVYEYIRHQGITDPWVSSILPLISPDQVLLSDYKFGLEILIKQKDYQSITLLLEDCAKNQPVFAELLLEFVVENLLKNGHDQLSTQQAAMEILLTTMVALDKKIDNLDRVAEKPMITLIQRVLEASRASTPVLLEGLYAKYPLVIARFASAVINIQSHEDERASEKLGELVWTWKLNTSIATPTDLHHIMHYYIRRKEPAKAIKTHARNKTLRRPWQSDALLLAAAQAQDWTVLQKTFEAFASQPNSEGDAEHKKVVDRHYAIVLRALGKLGGKEILENIFQRLLERHDQPPSPAVYQAMMHSYTVLGDTAQVQRYFDLMIQAGLTPNRGHFLTLLMAYRDANNLRTALETVGQMTVKYMIPFSNAELTILLSLCTRIKDLETAKKIFQWGKTLLGEPDAIAYNAYIDCLSETDTGEAWKVYETMPHTPSIYTLTSLMAVAARYSNEEKFTYLQNKFNSLKLKPDAKWFGAVMTFYSNTGQYEEAAKVIDYMKTLGIRVEGSYYGILMNAFTKAKLFDEANELKKLVQSEKIRPSHDLYIRYLRMLGKASKSHRLYGHSLATKVLDTNMFDPGSSSVPRSEAPILVIKGLVRSHIKHHNYALASNLLAKFSRQQAATNSYQLMALYMELDDAQKDLARIGEYWKKFMLYIQQATVPTQVNGKLVRQLPKRYRFDFSKQLSIRIKYLYMHGRGDDLVNFPKSLETVGLGMSTNNWNQMVKHLLYMSSPRNELITHAYSVANQWLMHGYFSKINPAAPKVSSGADVAHAQGTLGSSTLFALNDHAQKLFEHIARTERVEMDEAIRIAKKRYKLVMGPVLWRLRKNKQNASQPAGDNTNNAAKDSTDSTAGN